MAGKFVVRRGPTGTFRFKLVATDGRVVATSRAYATKAAAMTGLRAVRSLAGAAVIEDQTAPAPAARTHAAGGGGACGYRADVALFGGPPERRGCGQVVPPGNAASASPAVELPPGGSAVAITAAAGDGALARFGPAVLFGGKAPSSTTAFPRSGAIVVSTKGTTSVSSSASVKNVAAGPFTADGVVASARASKVGAKASTTIAKGVVVTAADAGGNPTATTKLPARPPANLTIKGTISTGDRFKLVCNEQKKGRDGSITVIGAHLYLLGPLAVGDVVVAEAHARA